MPQENAVQEITPDLVRVTEIRTSQGISLQSAKRMVLREALVQAITEAKTLDDLRPALLTLANLATRD